MLVKDLKSADRDAAIQEVLIRSRTWWHGSGHGALAHGMWIQLLKDISRKGGPQIERDVTQALREWNTGNDLWYIEGHGVDRGFLNRKMREWCFIGEGRDLPIKQAAKYYSRMEGDRVCNRCLKSWPITEYHRNENHPEGRNVTCKYCRNEKGSKTDDRTR